MLEVSDYMHRSVPTLSPQLGLSEALERLMDSAFGGLPVVDEKGQLIGFLSEQDCIPNLLSSSYQCDIRTRVEDLMSRTPLSVAATASILDVARQMIGAKPKVYPVMDEDKLVGLISRRDVIKVLHEQLKQCQMT